MNKDNERLVGMCSVCGHLHTNEDGYDDGRACRNCGEWSVYSIIEYRDIVEDWKKLKVEFDLLIREMDDGK